MWLSRLDWAQIGLTLLLWFSNLSLFNLFSSHPLRCVFVAVCSKKDDDEERKNEIQRKCCLTRSVKWTQAALQGMSAVPPGPQYVNQCTRKTAAAAQPCNIPKYDKSHSLPNGYKSLSERGKGAGSLWDKSYYAWKNSSSKLLPSSLNISTKKDFDADVLLN